MAARGQACAVGPQIGGRRGAGDQRGRGAVGRRHCAHRRAHVGETEAGRRPCCRLGAQVHLRQAHKAAVEQHLHAQPFIEGCREPRDERGTVKAAAGVGQRLGARERRHAHVGQIGDDHPCAQGHQAVDHRRHAFTARTRFIQQRSFGHGGVLRIEFQHVVGAGQHERQVLVTQPTGRHLGFDLCRHVGHLGARCRTHEGLGHGCGRGDVAFGKDKAVVAGDDLHPQRLERAVNCPGGGVDTVHAVALAVAAQRAGVVTESEYPLGHEGLELRGATATSGHQRHCGERCGCGHGQAPASGGLAAENHLNSDKLGWAVRRVWAGWGGYRALWRDWRGRPRLTATQRHVQGGHARRPIQHRAVGFQPRWQPHRPGLDHAALKKVHALRPLQFQALPGGPTPAHPLE